LVFISGGIERIKNKAQRIKQATTLHKCIACGDSNFMLYSLCSMLYRKASSNKIPATPLHPKKLSVPLQAILGYKPSGLSKKK
jgi:hypothetical protein